METIHPANASTVCGLQQLFENFTFSTSELHFFPIYCLNNQVVKCFNLFTTLLS